MCALNVVKGMILFMNRFKLFIDVLIPVVISGIVGFIINPYIDYNSLVQLPLSPPSIAFPIVWTILYILMGVSYYLLKNPDRKEKMIYFVQLGVNALWSVFFFVFKFYLFSFVWILLLDVLVILMIIIFCRNNKVSAYLQIPYLVWILFASYLNLGIYILN